MSISTEISRIQSAKADIKSAIEAKGVTVPSSATIDTFATYVSQISGGGPTPSYDNIITYTASSKLAETTSTSSSGLHSNAFSGASGQLTITSHTFENGVGTIEFDGDLITVGARAFYGCGGLTSIDIPSGVTSIGTSVFYNCTSLTSCTIGSGVTSIGNSAFSGCTSLTSIDIPDSVTSIGDSAFAYCTSLTSCTIGSGVTSIGNSAFRQCSGLTSIDIPDSVASIGGSLISDSGIQTITIGSGITYIDSCGLCCNNLTNGVTIKAVNPPTIPNCDWIFSVQSPIYVPAESVTVYQNDQCWSKYSQGIVPIT